MAAIKQYAQVYVQGRCNRGRQQRRRQHPAIDTRRRTKTIGTLITYI